MALVNLTEEHIPSSSPMIDVNKFIYLSRLWGGIFRLKNVFIDFAGPNLMNIWICIQVKEEKKLFELVCFVFEKLIFNSGI